MWTEMQYHIHNYVYSGLLRPYIMNRYVVINLELSVSIYILYITGPLTLK